ncbi:MAG: sucrose synthase [Spirochaetales bacterium]|nr:sucrose synthase [Spirochaetales bacterium]
MISTNLLGSIIRKKEQHDFKEFISYFHLESSRFFLKNDILVKFDNFCAEYKKTETFRKKSAIAGFLNKIQEMFVSYDSLILMNRVSIAKYHFYKLRIDGEFLQEISRDEYLDQKDFFATKKYMDEKHLHIDFLPFYDYGPSLKDPESLGKGISFLNKYLSSSIFSNPEKWNNYLFQFIKIHKYSDQQLLVNGNVIKNFDQFFEEINLMIGFLKKKPPQTPYASIKQPMKKAGFEPGWGNTAGRILESMKILVSLINEPTGELLENFITRIPMPLISKIAIISPHGWFAQENVLGRPDTGGQVIYILDQVRALEKHIKNEIELSGIDAKPRILVITRQIPDADGTTCDQKKEKIFQTDDCWIIRVPFRDSNMNVVRQWISRFHVWPYIERFTDDAIVDIKSEFSGLPDLIIGNYSDGNLSASLMSDKLDVIQCTIAHALEKTKYLFSDMYWKDNEENYNFSLQFTADMLAMNKSDFIITSTFQEIAGTEYSMGQYEAYQFFSLPEHFQVRSGINLFSPKFNIVSPGVDQDIYYPYKHYENRIEQNTKNLDERIFHSESDDIFGRLADPGKTPVFSMSRFDKIKNITGLIEAFGMSGLMRKNCNLIFSAGTIHPEKSADAEERAEIEKAHQLIAKYDLYHSVRWLPAFNRLETGEVYRLMADHRGVFVQPALFEAFGLTILEAMISGLPTFGTEFGGPSEIIEDGVSGFLINTSSPELISKTLERQIKILNTEEDRWINVSDNGIKRVLESYTWDLYSEKLVSLAKIYGFWRYSVTKPSMEKMNNYCDLIYNFLFKERAKLLSR